MPILTRPQAAVAAVLIAVVTGHLQANDEVPGAPQDRPIALTNATIHPVSGRPIEGGTLVFDKGVIQQVGTAVEIPKGCQTIDLEGHHVYPGLIEAHSQIGLVEINAVRATRDKSEVGSLNPNVRANVSVNPDSEVIPVTRANGVLIAVSAPSGGRMSGMASVLQLDGWTYEDMTLEAHAALVIDWPSPPSDGESAGLKILSRTFRSARAYHVAREAAESSQRYDIRYEALGPVLNGVTPLMVLANDAREIQAAVSFAEREEVRLIIFGGHDAEHCADLLKAHNVPVVIDSIHRRPRRRHEAYDTPYTLPARLKKAGVQFCISGSDRAWNMNNRNLPYHAATAAAHGLSPDDALRAITLSAAEILGIDDRVGSLDVGKHATLIVTTGDPLETTSNVTQAWVQGRKVQLSSRHTRLYDKYTEKYRQQDEAGK